MSFSAALEFVEEQIKEQNKLIKDYNEFNKEVRKKRGSSHRSEIDTYDNVARVKILIKVRKELLK